MVLLSSGSALAGFLWVYVESYRSINKLRFYVIIYKGSIAQIVIKQIPRNTYWARSSFLLISRLGLRTKTIGSLKGIHLYILRNIHWGNIYKYFLLLYIFRNIHYYIYSGIYIEVESSYLGVSNIEELRLYPLKSRKDSP